MSVDSSSSNKPVEDSSSSNQEQPVTNSTENATTTVTTENTEDTEMTDVDPSKDKPAKEGEATEEVATEESKTDDKKEETEEASTLEDVPKTVTEARAVKSAVEEKARAFLAKQTYRVIIPSFSAWFDRTKCHDIEKKSLPEFFNNKHRTKTPEIYMDYRNFMIDTYRLNPTEYLTFTACRRNLAGDVAAIMRVHSFLEQWGLINYQIDPETKPSAIGPQFTGHYQILLDAPEGLTPFIPAKNSRYTTKGKKPEAIKVNQDPTKASAVDASSTTLVESNGTSNGSLVNGTIKEEEKVYIKKENDGITTNLNIRRNLYDSTADAIALYDETQRQLGALNTRSYNCYTCGDDTTKVRYHNLRSKQSLSPLCFKNGYFPSRFSNGDYVKIVQAQSASTEWTDQEVLLLMEGIEMYEDDWNSIAYHVGTRNRESCIKKFLQLPIEDPYLVKSHKKIKVEEQEDDESNALVSNKRKAADDSTEPDSKIYRALKQFLKESSSKESEENEDDEQDSLDAKAISEILSRRASKLVKSEKEHQQLNLELLVETQLEKLNRKIEQFDRLEQVIAVEKQELEIAQQQLFMDRLALKRQGELVVSKLQQAAAQVTTNPTEALELANSATKIASLPLKRLIPTTNKEGSGAVSVELGTSSSSTTTENSKLKPVSLEGPQTFKLWSI